MVIILKAGMMKMAGITLYPKIFIAIIFADNAVISKDRNTKYIGASKYPHVFFLINKKPEINDAGKRIPRSSP